MTHLQASDQSISPSLSVETIDLLGGWLCLDFANTVDPRQGKHSHDYLTNYSDLVQWSHHAGVLTEGGKQSLLQAGAHHLVEAGKIFEQAIILREAMYRVFSAVAHTTAAERADLDVLQQAFAEA